MGRRKWRSRKVTLSEENCCFCGTNIDNEMLYGKMIHKFGIKIHYFCMLFASGLSQRGDSDEDGILGFLPKDIIKEMQRANRLTCRYCRKTGATIGCVVKVCRKTFHLGCGSKNGSLHQFFGSFSSFCSEHRPRQTVPACRDRLSFHGTCFTTCSLCLCSVEARSSNDTLKAPCCKNSWFHKDCLQKQALSSGYFFKCALCNNKEIFQSEMLKFGIYIPEQDAAWEMEDNAFSDLLICYNRCDVEPCRCPYGREYIKTRTVWEIIRCCLCGSQGCHLGCEKLSSSDEMWQCPECRKIISNSTKSLTFSSKEALSTKVHVNQQKPTEATSLQENIKRKASCESQNCHMYENENSKVMVYSPAKKRHQIETCEIATQTSPNKKVLTSGISKIINSNSSSNFGSTSTLKPSSFSIFSANGNNSFLSQTINKPSTCSQSSSENIPLIMVLNNNILTSSSCYSSPISISTFSGES